MCFTKMVVRIVKMDMLKCTLSKALLEINYFLNNPKKLNLNLECYLIIALSTPYWRHMAHQEIPFEFTPSNPQQDLVKDK